MAKKNKKSSAKKSSRSIGTAKKKTAVKAKKKIKVKPVAKKASVKKPVKKTLSKTVAIKKVKPVAAKPVAVKPVVKPVEVKVTKPTKIKAEPVKERPAPVYVAPEIPIAIKTPPPQVILNGNHRLLDEPQGKKRKEKNRYSDGELKEFKVLITKKLEDARKELANYQSMLNNTSEHGTDDTASTFKMLEDGSEALAKEEAGQLAARQKKFIEQLENALVRIENKTYGICRVTGRLIPKERLRAVPHTTQSIEAKMHQYKD